MGTWWFMTLNNSEELLSFKEVPDVDSKPGLYAWYLRIKPGKGNTKSPENFLRALKKITEQFYYPTLAMQLQGHLGLNWKGKLKHIWYGHDDSQFSDSLNALNNPEEMEILNDILELTVPLLTGPLYIGVSKNLRVRLQQHTQLIQAYQEDTIQFSQFSPIDIDGAESLENDRNFAQRIVERKIDPNHLVVGVIYVCHPHYSIESIHKAVKNAETLLNRIFHPILGRK